MKCRLEVDREGKQKLQGEREPETQEGTERNKRTEQ